MSLKPDNLSSILGTHRKVEEDNWLYRGVLLSPHTYPGPHTLKIINKILKKTKVLMMPKDFPT